MKIGLLSDSHGHADRVAAACRALVEAGAEAIVHCGDLGGPEVLRVLGDAGVRAWAVAGNTDRDLPVLTAAARAAGVLFHPGAAYVPLGNEAYLCATHGHDRGLLERVSAEPACRWVATGHSHRPHDVREDGVRYVNPGALHRAPRYTAALVDTDAETVRLIEVDA